VSGLCGVIMSKELCSVIESVFEEIAGQLFFPGIANFWGDLPPHVTHDNNVAKRTIPTHLQECFETLGGGACEPHI